MEDDASIGLGFLHTMGNNKMDDGVDMDDSVTGIAGGVEDGDTLLPPVLPRTISVKWTESTNMRSWMWKHFRKSENQKDPNVFCLLCAKDVFIHQHISQACCSTTSRGIIPNSLPKNIHHAPRRLSIHQQPALNPACSLLYRGSLNPAKILNPVLWIGWLKCINH